MFPCRLKLDIDIRALEMCLYRYTYLFTLQNIAHFLVLVQT